MGIEITAKFTASFILACSILAISQSISNKAEITLIASSTVYFVPHVDDYCPTEDPCEEFIEQVKLQGSGTLPGNKILTYTGEVVSTGACETAFGASGKCLKPYISVAADPLFYKMGDIIEMPAMKGVVLTLPNGKTMIHPGYFIVDDTGAAVRGRNRFDFFTGPYGMNDPANAFGSRSLKRLRFHDRSDRSPHKAFSLTRLGAVSYDTKLAAIEKSVKSASTKRTSVSVRMPSAALKDIK